MALGKQHLQNLKHLLENLYKYFQMEDQMKAMKNRSLVIRFSPNTIFIKQQLDVIIRELNLINGMPYNKPKQKPKFMKWFKKKK